MRRCSARWLLAAVAAVPLALVTSAFGQARIGDDGHALDSNTRIGSYGYNSTPNSFLPTFNSNAQIQTQVGNSLGNLLVTGNVTGGKEFRGGVPYTDPRDFRGNLGSASFDRFIAGSSGTPAAGQGIAIPGEVTSFYGARMVTPPPKGFAEQGFSGTFTPAPAATTNKPIGMEIRVGNQLLNSQMLNPAELAVPGPVDPATQVPTLLTASPLLGIRSLNSFEADNPLNSALRIPGQEGLLSRMRLAPAMLGGDTQNLLPQAPGFKNQLPNTDSIGVKPLGESGNLARPMVTPFDAPQNNPLNDKPLNADVTAKPLENTVRPEQSQVSRLANPINPPSVQYNELQKRLERYYLDRLQTDEDHNRELVKQLREKAAADKAQEANKNNVVPAPGVLPRAPGAANGPASLGPTTPMPDYARISKEITGRSGQANAAEKLAPGTNAGPLTTLPPVVSPEPMQIRSMAQGVQSQDLAKVLGRAEELMHNGKFQGAMQQYEAAEAIAPNQLLIRLGRANAELGFGAYKRAEVELRQVLKQDPVLTMAKFDLKDLFGQQRLETLVKTLKQIADQQKDDAGLAFLLAYLAYNTDNPQQAKEYLNLADQRSGGKDEFYRMLKTHWKLPPQ